MKKIIALSLSFTMALATQASDLKTESTTKKDNSGEKCFDEGTHLIGVGAGFGGFRSFHHAGGSYSRTPTMFVNYEQPWKDRLGPGYLGIGAYVGFQHSSYRYNDHGSSYWYEHTWNSYFIAARAAYHWDVLNSKNAEVYAGVLVGVRIQTYSYDSNFPSNYYTDYQIVNRPAYPSVSGFIGARWYFVKSIALFAEVGPGHSFATAGLNFKF